MFTLQTIVTTTILIGSVLIQQSAIGYPKAAKKLEINYLKASLENIYGTITPKMVNYLEQLHNNQDPSTEMMLSGGYQICDGIKIANNQGLSSKALIEREIDNISHITNSMLQQKGMSLTEDQIITAYNTANNYLCPELK